MSIFQSSLRSTLLSPQVREQNDNESYYSQELASQKVSYDWFTSSGPLEFDKKITDFQKYLEQFNSDQLFPVGPEQFDAAKEQFIELYLDYERYHNRNEWFNTVDRTAGVHLKKIKEYIKILQRPQLKSKDKQQAHKEIKSYINAIRKRLAEWQKDHFKAEDNQIIKKNKEGQEEGEILQYDTKQEIQAHDQLDIITLKKKQEDLYNEIMANIDYAEKTKEMPPNEKFENDFQEYKIISTQCIVEKRQKNLKDSKNFQLLLKFKLQREKDEKIDSGIISILNSTIERHKEVEDLLGCSVDQELLETLQALPKIDNDKIHLMEMLCQLEKLVQFQETIKKNIGEYLNPKIWEEDPIKCLETKLSLEQWFVIYQYPQEPGQSKQKLRQVKLIESSWKFNEDKTFVTTKDREGGTWKIEYVKEKLKNVLYLEQTSSGYRSTWEYDEKIGFQCIEVAASGQFQYTADMAIVMKPKGEPETNEREDLKNQMATRAELLTISKDLEELRKLLLQQFESFKVLAADEKEKIDNFEKHIFKVNMLIYVFQRIHQGNYNDQQIQHRGINKFTEKMKITRALFNYFKESETKNVGQLEDQLKKAAISVNQFKSDNMFRLSLGKNIYIVDFLRINQESDDKLEFNLLYRKSDSSYASLWAQKMSFKDFQIIEKSEEKMIVGKDVVYMYPNAQTYSIIKELFHENCRFIIYGSIMYSSETFAIIYTIQNKFLQVSVQNLNHQLIEKIGQDMQEFQIFKPSIVMLRYPMYFISNERVYHIIEEQNTGRKYLGCFEVELQENSQGQRVPFKMNCIHTQEISIAKQYLQFGNPQLLSKDLISIEAWNPLKTSCAEAIYIFKFKDGKIGKLYDVLESQKQDTLYRIHVTEENLFTVFSQNKVKIFNSERDQLQLILEQTFEKTTISILDMPYIRNEIFAQELIKIAGSSYQRNLLFYDRGTKSVGKISCNSAAVIKLTTKNLVESEESIVITIPGHQNIAYYQQDKIFFYYSSQENLKTIKTLTDVNSNEGDKMIYQNNFFLRLNTDTKDIMCGIVTPYNGFVITSMNHNNDQIIACTMDYLGQVAQLISSDSKAYIIRVYDSVQLKYSYEYSFEFTLKEEEAFVDIQFGKYEGNLFFLLTDKNQIVAINYTTQIEVTVVQEPDESVKEIQFAPNMQWVLNIYKNEDYRSPVLRSLTQENCQFELPGITRLRVQPNQKRDFIKQTIELSPMDNKKKLEDQKKFLEIFQKKLIAVMDSKYETIDFVSFSQVVSDQNQQELLLVINQKLQIINLTKFTTQEQVDKPRKIRNLCKIPVFYHPLPTQTDFNYFCKVLEIKPRNKERKFLLQIERAGTSQIFDLCDLTMKNHVRIYTIAHDNTGLVKIDCNNNLISIRRGKLMNFFDLDNVFCQHIRPEQMIHSVRYLIQSDKIEKQFFQTFINTDLIFKTLKYQEVDPKFNNKNWWFKVQSTSDHILTYMDWYYYTVYMFQDQEPVLKQTYCADYPQMMLNLLHFKNDSQILQLIDDQSEEYEKLIVPYRAFANLNCLSLYATNQLILRNILSKQGNSKSIIFYQQSKMIMDMDMILLWQDQYKIEKQVAQDYEQEASTRIYQREKFEKIQIILQIMLDNIGNQTDQYSLDYIGQKLKIKSFDLKYLNFVNFLNSEMVLMKLNHRALPSLQKEQLIIVCPQGTNMNFFDQYFDFYTEKKNQYAQYCMPSQLKKSFYDEAIILNSGQEDDDNLVKADFHMMNVQNLMDGDFIYELYETQGDDLFFQTKFVQYFIKYVWQTEVKHTLLNDIFINVFIIALHFVNMLYMNLEICGDLSVQNCVSSTSYLAVENGRLSNFVYYLGWLEFIMCLYVISAEFFELLSEGADKYFDNWTWNLNDLVMPASFIIGFIYDDQSEADDFVRVTYTITTMSLLFVFLQKLRLTTRFSFIVICIFQCFADLGDFIMFLFLLVAFLTVSYSNINYQSPYADKFPSQIAIFIQMFKSALGESQTDEILALNGVSYYVGWALYIFLAFFTTIVYMNILIAVVSDQFERIYETKELELYKRRLPYIFKVYRKKVKLDQYIVVIPETENEGDEWSGWISQVKKFLVNNSLKINEQISSMKKEIQSSLEKKSQEQNEMITKADFKIQELKDYIQKSENKNQEHREEVNLQSQQMMNDVSQVKEQLARVIALLEEKTN